MGVSPNTILRHLKLRPQSVTRAYSRADVNNVCAEMDEQWGYVGAKSRQRWLFPRAYDRPGRRLMRTYSVNALWRRWGVFMEPAVTL